LLNNPVNLAEVNAFGAALVEKLISHAEKV